MISSVNYLEAQFALSQGLGDRSLQSDATFVIDGFEYLSLLIKNFPWPVLSTAGEVEVTLPNGQGAWQPQQLKTQLQGQVTITETAAGHAYEALTALARQGTFNATILEGDPTNFSRSVRIKKCFIVVDPADRDHESRSQVTQFSGNLFFHFFGEVLPGNVQAAGASILSAIGAARG